MIANSTQGFTSLEREIEIAHLPVNGKLPFWLSGALVRNGPAKFEVGAQKYRHWFDGLAMLHCFTFKDGTVSYANKFLQSHDYTVSTAKGKITCSTFATDPCRSIFQRVLSIFSPKGTENANVNVTRLADRFLAITETPLPIEFDPHTLETLGVFDYDDRLPGAVTTAHPHADFARHSVVNYLTQFSRRSRYHIYSLAAGHKRRELIGVVPVQEPSYMHSFGITENSILLVEFPLVVNPLRLLLQSKPFIENFEWKPERGARFNVVSKRDGSVKRYTAEAFFAFHHVNAFEQHGDIFVDVAAYPDKRVIDAFYLDRLRAGEPIPGAQLRRYRLPASGASANYEVLSSEAMELPRLNYQRCNAKDYCFAYGVSTRADCPGGFYNQLVKVEVRARTTKVWREEECYVGEPVFVAAPGGRAEDEGVILSVVLKGKKGNSFLLVLDARSFAEIARAEVPQHIPFGFHGQFFAGEFVERHAAGENYDRY
jgi:carotenoid cleavage dioxygenase-like enzyme